MSDFVKAEQVFLDNPASTVDEALEFLANKAAEAGLATDAAAALAAFKEREAMFSVMTASPSRSPSPCSPPTVTCT